MIVIGRDCRTKTILQQSRKRLPEQTENQLGGLVVKKLLATLLLLACSVMVHAQAAKDVPSGHWAYDAVQALSAKGYMSGFPDGTFKGERSLTRYEFAKVVNAILEDMTAKIESSTKTVTTTPATTSQATAPEVTKADLDRIERLVTEFKTEIAAQLGTTDQGVGDKVNELSTKYDALQDEIAKLKATVDTHEAILADPEGPFETAKLDIKNLKKIAISGFVQARWQGLQGGLHGGTAAKPTDPAGTNTYTIRRSRLKVTASPTTNSQIVLQADFGGTAVSLKDAYILYKLNDLTNLTMGQETLPFGHQLMESDTVREMPERSMINGIFFPNERDRGAYLNGSFKSVNWYFGSFNGAGLNTNDTNRRTDLVGRISKSIGDLDLGASGYLGSGYNVGKNAGRKNRYGVDMRYYLHGITLKTEYLWAENTELAQVRGFDKIINGGYAQLAYNVLPDLTLVGNYERMSQDITSIVDYGLRESYNAGLIKYLDEKTKLKFFYQFNKEEKNTVRNNQYIVELISSF